MIFIPAAITSDKKRVYTEECFQNGIDAMKMFYTWESVHHYNLDRMWVTIEDEDTGEVRQMKVEREYKYVDEEVTDEFTKDN